MDGQPETGAVSFCILSFAPLRRFCQSNRSWLYVPAPCCKLLVYSMLHLRFCDCCSAILNRTRPGTRRPFTSPASAACFVAPRRHLGQSHHPSWLAAPAALALFPPIKVSHDSCDVHACDMEYAVTAALRGLNRTRPSTRRPSTSRPKP